MKRTLNIIATAIASIVVVGSVASASPSLRASFGLRSSATSASGATGITGASGAAEATGATGETEATGETGPTGTTGSVEVTGAEDTTEGTGQDFSTCAGLTGLDNAICRHEVLLALNPDNPGLANSLVHLQANLAKHAGDAATTESSSSSDPSSCPGHSCDPHGNSGGSYGNSNG